MRKLTLLLGLLIAMPFVRHTVAQVKEPGFKVFQFPRTAIPRIDGDFTDWDIVPSSYTITIDDMWDDTGKHPSTDRSTLDIKVKVGWVNGLNRLYFLYEAYDDFWDFNQLSLHNDTYEIVVDADLSGGPHTDEFRLNPDVMSRIDAFFEFQNQHAQNYHIMTPPTEGKSWTMVWGPQQWLKYLPYANYATTMPSNMAKADGCEWSSISRPSTTPALTGQSIQQRADFTRIRK